MQPLTHCRTVHLLLSSRKQTLKRDRKSLATRSGSATSFCSKRSHNGPTPDGRASSPAATIAATPRAVKWLCDKCISSMLVHFRRKAARASAPSSSKAFLKSLSTRNFSQRAQRSSTVRNPSAEILFCEKSTSS